MKMVETGGGLGIMTHD